MALLRSLFTLVAFAVAFPSTATEIADISQRKENASPLLSANRILIVASNESNFMANRLADLLTTYLSVDVTMTDNANYAPLIDERAHDGFIYLGADYASVPKQGFLDDIARTSKPVFWINYHAWLLEDAFLRRKGLRIADEHPGIYGTLIFHTIINLPNKETTHVEAETDNVLYWLHDDSRTKLLPGAVHSGRFTFLSYFPSVDSAAPDFAAFLSALRKTFGTGPARAKTPPNFEERMRNVRADKFWTGVHLPRYVAQTSDDAIGYDSDLLHRNLMRIKETGAEWVTVVQNYYQDGIHAEEI